MNLNKQYLEELKRYNRLLKEGYDVVLPPEPLIPVSSKVMAAAGGNYPMQRAMIDTFVNNVVAKEGINQKVMIITIDTGAKSKNKYIQTNFVDEGLDHTGENQPFDENGHFSFCVSQQLGFANGYALGPLAHPSLPKDFWLHSGEKGLMKGGSASYTMLNKAVEHALGVANKYKAKGYRVFISCSWGGGGSNQQMTQLFKAIRDAGHFAFVAAGNSGQNGVNNPGNIPPDAIGHLLMTIGAVDRNDKVAYFSSRGSQLEFMSYGVNNYGCGPGSNELKNGSGTSFSTPFACASAALLCAVFPQIENMNDLFYVLREGATPLGDHKDYGYGLIRMDQYAEDDLPDDNPDEPEEPEQPEDEMPERELKAVLEGEYALYYATLPNGSAVMKMDGISVHVNDTPELVTLQEGNPGVLGYDWKLIRFRDLRVQLGASTRRGEDIIGELNAFIGKFFNNGSTSRGIVMQKPADFVLGGEWGLYFARMLAQKAGLPVEQVTAIVIDDQDNAAAIANKER